MRAWLLPLLLLLAACDPGGKPGNSLRLDELQGQWVVINYWAVWCKPCAQEIPELNTLAELPGVTVLGVNFDGAGGEELEQQLRQLDIRFPTLEVDPAVELGVARPVVLPTSLVIDPSGKLRETLVGPQTLQSLAAATGQAQKKPAQKGPAQ
jgi:thiol-disulfide isomerase/thioredoxin